MLWEVDIYPRPDQPDRQAEFIRATAAELGLVDDLVVTAARGYLVQGESLDAGRIDRLARELLADPVVERTVVAAVGDPRLSEPPEPDRLLVHVLNKPGVMDPVAQSTVAAIADFGFEVDAVRTLRKYWIAPPPEDVLQAICSRILANDAIEQVLVGPLPFKRLESGGAYEFQPVSVPILDLDDAALMRLSREGQLYLQLEEMRTIQGHFRSLGREPSDIELETLAQTWSEHCSHKTLAGRIAYRDERSERHFENMLKETIFAATQQIRAELGADDWCVSVFKDNAGIVRFDDALNVAFKVETHNHPSALEPYGGANTGVGGVIRDTLGTGLGAKPICNTDVFCFAPPDTPTESLPPGVLHPRRVIQGVVAGVRDYGNRMGIPTVNGAIYFDPRYLGNPLVYCGNVGLIPRDKSHKQTRPGDYVVAVGGRTGRDGIHGATFSSAELTSQSEELSGGAVQIGNAITEKMLMDVLLQARDRGLYSSVTDCGAGGFSSAVGEMGADIGAEVWLDRVPLKYAGLSYTEIWISEAQERMVLSVPPDSWDELSRLCAAEGVEATIIGEFVPSGRLVLKYNEAVVGELDMEFLHDGRPPVVRRAEYKPEIEQPFDLAAVAKIDCGELLEKILGSLNVASKAWVIRQYDHEVQGGSVIKPLVGAHEDGPSDAAVIRPVLDSQRGVVVACGMNPRFGDFDTYHMAASAIDEAVRNCVAVGADPARIALLDNFCWGDCEQPGTLGSLVRAALACHDLAVAWRTPFISGKDSLNNEFHYTDAGGMKHTLAIPPSLLISALGQVDDVAGCVTMDMKAAGSRLYLVGTTHNELGGSHLGLVGGQQGGRVPRVDPTAAMQVFQAVHAAIHGGYVRACHDLSEGGLAVAAAEMAFAGDLGAELFLRQAVVDDAIRDLGPADAAAAVLFSESNTRFLVEVPEQSAEAFERAMSGVSCGWIGRVTSERSLRVYDAVLADDAAAKAAPLVDAPVAQLKEAWQRPLDW
ncbi:MAG: phosphoribosylformylglycinamidine synthase subunit PurL [Pirellulales bacterium]